MDSVLTYLGFLNESSSTQQAFLLVCGVVIVKRIKSITIRFINDPDH